MTAPEPRLLALVCPACGARIDGEPGARLYLCTACPTAVDVAADGAAGYPVRFAEHAKGAAGRLSWILEARIAIRCFSATQETVTPFGPLVPGQTGELNGRFLVPSDPPLPDAFRRARLRTEAGVELPDEPRQEGTSAPGGSYGRREAERIARQVFSSIAAGAPGAVRHLDFDLTVTGASVLFEERGSKAGG